jgi:hypothetical protein
MVFLIIEVARIFLVASFHCKIYVLFLIKEKLVGLHFGWFFSQAHQGPMLSSQFSAIFDNFWRKNWRFSQKPIL